MSLPLNSDYDIISTAEVSSIIDKYSPEMLNISLNGVLQTKETYHNIPIGNMIEAFEHNFKRDLERIPQYQADMLERRAELYTSITEKVCAAHNMTFNVDPNMDIYSASYYIYDFLVSHYYQFCIEFFSTFLSAEAESICKMLEDSGIQISAHQYAKKRYGGKYSSIGVIHTHLNEVLDMLASFDISFETIIRTEIKDPATANFMLTALTDNGDFFKDFYMRTISGSNRAEAVTNIRFKLMPVMGMDMISEFIENEEEGDE